MPLLRAVIALAGLTLAADELRADLPAYGAAALAALFLVGHAAVAVLGYSSSYDTLLHKVFWLGALLLGVMLMAWHFGVARELAAAVPANGRDLYLTLAAFIVPVGLLAGPLRAAVQRIWG